MNIKTVRAVFFSPAGSTGKMTVFIAETLAKILEVPLAVQPYTLPENRSMEFVFERDDLVVWGTPVYAGRIPNKTLEFVAAAIRQNRCPMIPVVMYGNRSFDNALAELTGLMEDNGCPVPAAAAMVSRHVFSKTLAAGRPSAEDYEQAAEFCRRAADVIRSMPQKADGLPALEVPGEKHPTAYYVPKKEDGTPAKFLKARPVTDEALCDGCGRCAQICPMGSIHMEGGLSATTGICIKCQACILECPQKARTLTDTDFLSHTRMVETNFTEPKTDRFWYNGSVDQ